MQYKAFDITYGKLSITIPPTEISDLFEPNLNYTKVFYDRINDVLYISISNGDMAGGYVGVFIVKKGIYRGRIVTIGV